MPDFAVHPRGTDPNGRTIFATDFMWSWWQRVCDDLGFTPTIVQGAFMTRAGGGAAASAGYHDLGGCFDLRVWDQPGRADDMVRTLRRYGAGAWLRDHRHGMDPHIHFVLGTDRPLTSGAAFQWQAYKNGRNGLANNGPDYHWRPSPLVTTPPEEDDMPFTEKELRKIIREETSEALADVVAEVAQIDDRTQRIMRAERLTGRKLGVDVDRPKKGK